MSEIYDLNTMLYFANKSGKLDEFRKMLDKLEPLFDVYLSFDIEQFVPNEKTSFTTENMFSIVYKFLNECYPDKAYLYANYIERGDNIVIREQESFIELQKLIYEMLSYFLKKYNIDIAVEMLEKELKNSGISEISYNEILEFIKLVKDALMSRKGIFSKKMKFKSIVWKEIVDNSSHMQGSGIYRKENGCSEMLIINNNDVLTLIQILHEYIHKDNEMFFCDQKGNHIRKWYSILIELPSIAMEVQFIDWLKKNELISDSDCKYVMNERMFNTYGKIVDIKLIKMIMDIYFENKGVSYDRIKKEIEKVKNKSLVAKLKNRMIEVVSYLIGENVRKEVDGGVLEVGNLNSTIDKSIVLQMSYVISTILSPTILNRSNIDYSYRDKFIKVNDNIMTIDYYEALRILDLDYDNGEVQEEIKNNLLDYYQKYSELQYSGFGKKR